LSAGTQTRRHSLAPEDRRDRLAAHSRESYDRSASFELEHVTLENALELTILAA
jgi:hypothetical protein